MRACAEAFHLVLGWISPERIFPTTTHPTLTADLVPSPPLVPVSLSVVLGQSQIGAVWWSSLARAASPAPPCRRLPITELTFSPNPLLSQLAPRSFQPSQLLYILAIESASLELRNGPAQRLGSNITFLSLPFVLSTSPLALHSLPKSDQQ